MSDYRRDFESQAEHLQRVEREARERATFDTDIGAAIDAKPLPEIVVKPGNQHARRAFALGMDDEYANRMKARYGGEW